jgi:hypothetical protein
MKINVTLFAPITQSLSMNSFKTLVKNTMLIRTTRVLTVGLI